MRALLLLLLYLLLLLFSEDDDNEEKDCTICVFGCVIRVSCCVERDKWLTCFFEVVELMLKTAKNWRLVREGGECGVVSSQGWSRNDEGAMEGWRKARRQRESEREERVKKKKAGVMSQQVR